MGFRKHGVAGEVTGVEQDGISKEAANKDWGPSDDEDLARENAAADQASRDDD